MSAADKLTGAANAPDLPNVGHVNPPLHTLNLQYREDDAERRGEISDTVRTIQGALDTALAGKSGKRVQKPLRAPA